MHSTWVIPLISALSGVGGAAIGAGALVWANRRDYERARERDRAAAWVGLYSASNAFALVWQSWASIAPDGSWFAEVRAGIRVFGLERPILERLWHTTDHFWQASGRARSVATAEEIEVVDGIETVIADWTAGEPMPEAWGPAIRRLRSLIERQAAA